MIFALAISTKISVAGCIFLFRKWTHGSFEYYRDLVTGPEAGVVGGVITTGIFLTREHQPVSTFVLKYWI